MRWIAIKKLLSSIGIDLRDVFCFGGLAMIGTGLWGYDWRVSLVVVGILLMLMGQAVLIIKMKKGSGG